MEQLCLYNLQPLRDDGLLLQETQPLKNKNYVGGLMSKQRSSLSLSL